MYARFLVGPPIGAGTFNERRADNRSPALERNELANRSLNMQISLSEQFNRLRAFNQAWMRQFPSFDSIHDRLSPQEPFFRYS